MLGSSRSGWLKVALCGQQGKVAPLCLPSWRLSVKVTSNCQFNCFIRISLLSLRCCGSASSYWSGRKMVGLSVRGMEMGRGMEKGGQLRGTQGPWKLTSISSSLLAQRNGMSALWESAQIKSQQSPGPSSLFFAGSIQLGKQSWSQRRQASPKWFGFCLFISLSFAAYLSEGKPSV